MSLKLNKKAQQFVEYLLVLVGVVAGVVAVSRTGGVMPNAVERSLNMAVDTISGNYFWRLGTPGACSVSCGIGTAPRSVWCEDENSSVVQDVFCASGVGPKPPEAVDCFAGTCASWWAGGFGACQPACGASIRTQVVECRHNVTNQVVDGSQCDGSPPPTTQDCTDYTLCQCTGSQPANSTACPDATTGLTSDLPWTLGNCSVKCQAQCNPFFTANGNNCDANVCGGAIATNASQCAGDDVNIPSNSMSWTLVDSCSPAKCESTCNSFYHRSGSSCAVNACAASGPVANSTACANTTTNVPVHNTSWSVVNRNACTGAKCQSSCNLLYKVQAGICVPSCGDAICQDGNGGRPNYGESCGNCSTDCNYFTGATTTGGCGAGGCGTGQYPYYQRYNCSGWVRTQCIDYSPCCAPGYYLSGGNCYPQTGCGCFGSCPWGVTYIYTGSSYYWNLYCIDPGGSTGPYCGMWFMAWDPWNCVNCFPVSEGCWSF